MLTNKFCIIVVLAVLALAVPVGAQPDMDTGNVSVDRMIQNLKIADPGIRLFAVEALESLNDTKALEPLIQALIKDKDPNVRGNAALALVTYNNTSAVKPLIQALKDEDASVRMFAAYALESLNDTRAVKPMIQALKDKNASVRAWAAASLGNLDDTEAVEPLIKTLKDEHADVRVLSAIALGKLNDTKAVEPLIQALKDENASVRAWAAASLGNLSSIKAYNPLFQALKDNDPNVRKRASDALRRINATIEGSLELHVVSAVPGVFNEIPLANGKYPAGNASVSIYQPDLNFSYKGSADKLGKLIIKDLPIGLNNYEISWPDFRGDRWGAKGSVFIKRDSREKESVELKWIG